MAEAVATKNSWVCQICFEQGLYHGPACLCAKKDERPQIESSVRKNTACAWQVCLAFESMEVGQHMLGWATKFCLFPDDEVYIVHCLSKVQSRVLDYLIATLAFSPQP